MLFLPMEVAVKEYLELEHAYEETTEDIEFHYFQELYDLHNWRTDKRECAHVALNDAVTKRDLGFIKEWVKRN